ncbi:MAG TPA: LysM domain-containing protein, partial [Acidimicrobiia bacterium]|nr:LysM domain-containing protein [Acidimicrobiia bacterium]
PLIGIIYLGATIAAIALLALQIVRMRRLRTIRNHSQVRVVSKGEDIVSIAKENDMNWKDLAKLNNLKKPYILNENDTINVPKKR